MEQQEYFMRINMLGQEAEKIEQQIQAIEQQIAELSAVRESLEAIKTNSDKEILAHLGKGIFVKADLKEKELFVNIGKDVIIKKTPEETIKVIESETKRLVEGKEAFIDRIQTLQEEMHQVMAEMQHKQGKPACSKEDCECEEPCEDCECEHEHK